MQSRFATQGWSGDLRAPKNQEKSLRPGKPELQAAQRFVGRDCMPD
jgi:hypothetical protein